MIPMLMQVKVRTAQGRYFRIWLPLFLVWLLALPVVPVLLLALLIGAALGQLKVGQTLRVCWGLLNGLKGLLVDVQCAEADVLVRVC